MLLIVKNIAKKETLLSRKTIKVKKFMRQKIRILLKFWMSNLAGKQDAGIEFHKWEVRNKKVRRELMVTPSHLNCKGGDLADNPVRRLKLWRLCTIDERTIIMNVFIGKTQRSYITALKMSRWYVRTNVYLTLNFCMHCIIILTLCFYWR